MVLSGSGGFVRTDFRGYALSTHVASRYNMIRARGYTYYTPLLEQPFQPITHTTTT